MRNVDLTELLNDAAPSPGRKPDVGALWRHGRLQRRCRQAALAAVPGLVIAVGALAFVAGGEDTTSVVTGPATSSPTSPASASSVPAPTGPPSTDLAPPAGNCDRDAMTEEAGDGEVLVYFFCGELFDPLVPRARAVPDPVTPLTGAIEALLAGPTAEEAAAGLYTGFSWRPEDEIQSLTISASVDGGVAMVEIIDATGLWDPGALSSAQLFSLSDPLYYAVFQFPTVDVIDVSRICWGEMGCGQRLTRHAWEEMESTNRGANR